MLVFYSAVVLMDYSNFFSSLIPTKPPFGIEPDKNLSETSRSSMKKFNTPLVRLNKD